MRLTRSAACLAIAFCIVTGSIYSHGLSWDTPVKIWNSSKNIHDISKKPSKNKKVVSYSFRKNRCTSGYIKSSGKSETNCYMRIGLGNDFTNFGHDDLLCTPAQEFYLPNQNKWISACQLKVGDVLKSDSVGSIPIIRIEFVNQPLTVYTLEVSKHHNFFVGKYFVLTHNTALPWEVTLGFSVPFGSACTGGRLGGFFGPVGIASGVVIGGLVGLLVEKIINKDKVQEYVAHFDIELIGGWVKASGGPQQQLDSDQNDKPQLPEDPNRDPKYNSDKCIIKSYPEKAMKDSENHIFSGNHRTNGIMDLGKKFQPIR